jgi:hypothetical protein
MEVQPTPNQQHPLSPSAPKQDLAVSSPSPPAAAATEESSFWSEEHQGIEQVATSLDNRLQSFRGSMQTVEQQTQAIREMVEADALERTNILDQLRVLFNAMKALQNNAEMKAKEQQAMVSNLQTIAAKQ